jgi:hypothetical protein
MNNSIAQDMQPKEFPARELAVTLNAIADKQTYPIDALGSLLGSAAKAIAGTVAVPLPIAAHSVLAVAAFAAQDKANIVTDGRTIPLSLFMLTIAESGDRKSACDNVASAPLLQWQRDKLLEFVSELQDYKNAKDVYASEHKKILASKRSANEKNTALNALRSPPVPLEPIAICQEPTLEGLQKSFKQGRPSQAIFSDEGGQFFGGHAMNPDNIQKTIAGLSKYWDGAPITRTRAAPGESSTMYGRRLSIHLLVQPVIASAVLGNPLLMAQGILARFLIAEADSLAGTRFYNSTNPYKHPAVVRFHTDITALLEQVPETSECGGLELPARSLSPEALEVWIAAYNSTERQLEPGGLLELIKPVASKAADNAIRIAGVFAVLERTNEVSAEQMNRAWMLATYYLQNALRAAQLGDASLVERDTAEILGWIKNRAGRQVTIDELQKKLTPVKHRKSVAHIRLIMSRLVDTGSMTVASQNNKGEPDSWKVKA